jgi:sirohydrochlorin ferrochelatase
MYKTEAEGYFLVTHGSRSPRSFAQVQELAQIVENQLGMTIGYGCLEGLELDLTTQIENFIDRSPSWQKVIVIPLFLWAGGHTSIDIPTAVQTIDRNIPVEIAPFFGSYAGIPRLLLDRFQSTEGNFSGGSARLLIVHGSSYSPALEAMETLADYLHARLAFWNRPATIGESIDHFLGTSIEKIIVLPYFLFAGKITESIGEMLSNHGQVVYLPPPLTIHQIANLIGATIRQNNIPVN